MLVFSLLVPGCTPPCTDDCGPDDPGSEPEVEVGNDIDLMRFPPVVVSTDPVPGELSVDPSIDTITVVFDKPMTEGWSWVRVGKDAEFPTLGDVGFVDSSTHEGDVSVVADETYSVWFNSPSGSFTGFADEDESPAVPYNLVFHTGDGGDPAVLDLFPPVVIDSVPGPRADDVDPSLDQITVTFNKDMAGLTGFGSETPRTFPRVGAAAFSDDRTATLDVELEPGATYAVWITDDFADLQGNPAVPWLLTFRTAEE